MNGLDDSVTERDMPGAAAGETAAEAAGRRLPRKLSAADLLYQALRERIVSLELVPGANLSRQQIAQDYGVSQTPVRDATQKLELEGLIIVYPQSRTVVAKIDLDHARETQFLRTALEVEVVRRLAERADAATAIVPAQRLLRQQRAALELDGDLLRFAALDRAFHGALCEAVGHPALWQVIADRSGHIDRLRTLNLPDPGKPHAILDFHGRILEAVGRGDAAAAEAAVRGHLSGTLATVEAIRARHPEFF